MLESIKAPQDLKGMSDDELKALADELRGEIISTVARTGGHLSSNLGTVELTIALHCEMDCPRDKIVFDVGHQAYAHKLLTGRYDRFSTLRQQGGISGFPRRSESEYDAFSVGHASTAISAALGMARARDQLGEDYRVAAVVGDGALTGGMCYEALNDLGSSRTHMTIVLNDNEMSIARNVGALSKHLTRLRNSSAYRATKALVRSRLGRLKHIGPPLIHLLEHIKDALKQVLVRGSFFEVFGLEYVGPVDGHDIQAIRRALKHSWTAERPVLLHIITQKGRGYAPAEDMPERFHGTAPFYIETGEAQSPDSALNSTEMASTLIDIMKSDPRAVGITAAMPSGTGMDIVMAHYPGRVFDVGIAEEHAMTLAAGMAAAGARPYVCLYSTFLQRAFDQVIHDVALDKLPVCLLIDRAGAVGADGATHQGIFDIAYLNLVPGMRIMSPRCRQELHMMMEFASKLNAPCAIRYAKNADEDICGGVGEIRDGQWERVSVNGDAAVDKSECAVTFVAVGCMVNTALRASQMLCKQGIRADVINARFIKPLDTDMLMTLHGAIITLEDGVVTGGFGQAVRMWMDENLSRDTRIMCLGYPDEFIEHAGRGAVLKKYGLDAESVASTAMRFVRENSTAVDKCGGAQVG